MLDTSCPYAHPALPSQLEELWLSNNRLPDLPALEPLAKLPQLQTLRLSGCPVAKQPDYRANVRAVVSASLTQLDADPV